MLNELHQNISLLSIAEEDNDEIWKLICQNASVQRLDHPEKWVYFFESSQPIDEEVLLISAWIHGDELAGVKIIDILRREILVWKLNLRKHVCFIDGNLKAMKQAMQKTSDGKIPSSRYWNPDKKYGIEANANRMWEKEYLQKGLSFWSYAANRRVEIWSAINSILLWWSDTSEFKWKLIHTDIHQSFKVPTVKDVRWEYHDESEYTYGMAYESETVESVNMLRQKFWDVYAWLVISDPDTAETFAAITAREFSSSSVTAELWTIWSPDSITYADRMLIALRRELEWRPGVYTNIGIDIWKQQKTIIRKQEEGFGFYDENWEIIEDMITDFVPTKQEISIRNNSQSFVVPKKTSFLFANRRVVIWDRAWVIITKM